MLISILLPSLLATAQDARTFRRGDVAFEAAREGEGTVRVRAGGELRYRIRVEPERAVVFAPELRVAVVAAPKVELADVEAWVVACEDARPAWEAHRAFLAQARSDDPAAARAGWARIATSLEEARRTHPLHLGILQDLIAAYGRVLALEGRSARALNLGILLPERIRDFERLAGGLDPREAAFVRKARGFLYFKLGLYPLAAHHLATAAPDPEDRALLDALAALKADRWDASGPLAVHGKTAAVEVAVYASRADAGPEAMLQPLRFFVPGPKGSAGPGNVWYTLSRQTSRYYLYGWVAGQPKLLRLYGARSPDDETVVRDVREHLVAALGGSP